MLNVINDDTNDVNVPYLPRLSTLSSLLYCVGRGGCREGRYLNYPNKDNTSNKDSAAEDYGVFQFACFSWNMSKWLTMAKVSCLESRMFYHSTFFIMLHLQCSTVFVSKNQSLLVLFPNQDFIADGHMKCRRTRKEARKRIPPHIIRKQESWNLFER